MPERPYINYAKCGGNGTCMEVCPLGVFTKENGKIRIQKPSECIQCRACEVSCPQKAIEVK